MKHKAYTDNFEGKSKLFLYNDYSGEIREPKRTIRDTSYNVIRIGEWQNKIREYNTFPIIIYNYNEEIMIDSNLILNLAKEIKKFKLKCQMKKN